MEYKKGKINTYNYDVLCMEKKSSLCTAECRVYYKVQYMTKKHGAWIHKQNIFT